MDIKIKFEWWFWALLIVLSPFVLLHRAGAAIRHKWRRRTRARRP